MTWTGTTSLFQLFKLDIRLQEMYYSVGFVHILYICNASCKSAENMVMMMMMMKMMSKRRRRGYLKTVTFESVFKTHHFLLYSSISVHCHTVNSLFRLPHRMLKVLHRNLSECYFINKVVQ